MPLKIQVLKQLVENNMQALAKVRVSETKRLTHEIKRLENHF